MVKESIRTRIKGILNQVFIGKFDPAFLPIIQKFANQLMPEIFKQNQNHH